MIDSERSEFVITALDGDSHLLAIPAIRRWLLTPEAEGGPRDDGHRLLKNRCLVYKLGAQTHAVLVWGSRAKVFAEVQLREAVGG